MSTGRASWAAAVLVAAALAGCGSGSDQPSGEKAKAAGEKGVGIVRAGSTAQFADCTAWRKGTVEQRYVTIRSIRGQLTPQSSKTAESPLPDKKAYAMFNKTCSAGFDSLRLYKLYARAQAFARLADQVKNR